MRYPKFNSEEERKQFWSGYLNVRGRVWALVGTKATMEQYMQKAQELAEEYIQQWESEHTATEVYEDVTTKEDEHKVHVYVTTPMQPAELEAIQNVDCSNENVDNANQNVDNANQNVETSINNKPEPRNVETYEQPELQQQICFPEDGIAQSQLDIVDTHFGMKKALKVIGIVLSVAGAMWLGNTVSGVFDNDFVSSIVYTVVTFFTGGVGVCLSLGVSE